MAYPGGLTRFEESLAIRIHRALVNGEKNVKLGKKPFFNSFGSSTKAHESMMNILQAFGRIYWRKFTFKTDPQFPELYRIEWN